MASSNDREQLNLRVDKSVAERLRLLASATGIRLNFIMERGVLKELAELEAKHRAEIDQYQRGANPAGERIIWLQDKIKIANENIAGRTGKAVANIISARDELQRELDELTQAGEETLQAGETGTARKGKK